ncbi:hypothetical protein niasHS_004657 [Heterodera schachtii]|uniref:Peptidase S1 domain-containing protein n=1 Tax=Heterodera schachtii TaxID=97005 RepID=A0ABD2K172_HETSC
MRGCRARGPVRIDSVHSLVASLRSAPRSRTSKGRRFAPAPCYAAISTISHGNPVKSNNKWPWLVALFAREAGICGGGSNKFCCTASIIGPQHVLTAAHCFMSFKGEQRENMHKNIFVRLGAYNHSSKQAIQPKLEKVIVHSGYDELTFVNDLAIIKLAQPMFFTENVEPICLASSTSEKGPNNNLHIVGWGHQNEAEYDEEGNERWREPDVAPEMLREGLAQMRNEDECAKLLHDKLGLSLDGRVCMEIGHQNSEPGDSGGPLMQLNQKGNIWTQIGVSSISTLKKDARVAILYTRVSRHCDWIEKNTDVGEASPAKPQIRKDPCFRRHAMAQQSSPNSRSPSVVVVQREQRPPVLAVRDVSILRM